MNLVSSTIPNLIGGVSQQPVTLRLASQGDLQENGFCSVVDGLQKRFPARYMAKVMDGNLQNPFTHVIVRDAIERYVVVVSNGDLKVFGLDGQEFTVNFPDGKAYLNAPDANAAFRAVTVADFTFLVNNSVSTSMATTRSPAQVEEALVWIKQGNYATTYRVLLNGSSVATVTTPDGSESSHANDIRTDTIASSLVSTINGLSDWTVTRRGSSFRIRRNNGASFTIRTEDSLGDQAISPAKGRIQRFSELPSRAFQNMVLEITGDNTSRWDNYYVRYNETGGSQNNGTWRETIAPDIPIRFNAATMPHVLVREADGTFTMRRASWNDRETGDELSSPAPSFIGKAITDVFFHRNRLGFISDENVIFSKSADFFNFWKSSAVALLDDDPVDVAASHVKVSILRHAVPFNEELLLFSDQTQFILSADDILTPTSAVIKQVTEFESSLLARPVGAGRFVYFAINRGGFTGIREYFTQGDAGNSYDSTDITANIPQYIPSDVFKIAANSNEGTMGFLSHQQPDSIYIYQYYYVDGEVIQACWHKWTLGESRKILNAEFIESDMILVVQDSDGVHLVRLPTEPGYRDAEADYPTLLDFRVDEGQTTVEYLPGADQTRITLPYGHNPDADRPLQVVTKSGQEGQIGGTVIPHTFDAQGNVLLEGDRTGLTFYIGETYPFRYRFAYPLLREDAAGGGQVAITAGRLQVRNMNVAFSNTGFFRAEVTPRSRETYTYTFTGRVLGSSSNVFGEVSLETGIFRFPVMAQNEGVQIDLVSDSFLPCTFLNAEWEGFYNSRSRRT